MNIPIKVTPGTIEIEDISGIVAEDHFLLYVTLREKYAEAECWCENPAMVSIRATEKTLRPIPENVNRAGGLDGADEYEKLDPSKEKPTEIELPVGWSVDASCSRYTCRIIGIRTPESEVLTPIPYEVAKP
jgi:hypothetical protein